MRLFHAICSISSIERHTSTRLNSAGHGTLTAAGLALAADLAADCDRLKQFLPAWMAYDMRLMGERFFPEAIMPEAGDVWHRTAP
ncbi:MULTISPECIES: hypothetical protein [unclassified Mesorhizobium]|uniref:hypothetical protein n=1 Tax=unclassified Mesorhizobium TaxID=325217 RepID=UPI001FED9062|nr:MULTISPECIES: hypothetical protein [unclassified Mesorhizobium]